MAPRLDRRPFPIFGGRPKPERIPWRGTILAVQPRIRLLRSFDHSSHTYLGYMLRLDGDIGDERREFSVGIGKDVQAKHAFRAGDEVSGEAVEVADPRLEPVEFYKVSRLKVEVRGSETSDRPPPWCGVPPELPIYRQRGHRRLDARTYDTKCWKCI